MSNFGAMIPIVDIATANATVTKVVPLFGSGCSTVSFQEDWGVTVGTWRFRISNDTRANPTNPASVQATARWYDVTAAIGLTDPNGVAATDYQVAVNLVGAYLECRYTPNLGFVGTLYMGLVILPG